GAAEFVARRIDRVVDVGSGGVCDVNGFAATSQFFVVPAAGCAVARWQNGPVLSVELVRPTPQFHGYEPSGNQDARRLRFASRGKSYSRSNRAGNRFRRYACRCRVNSRSEGIVYPSPQYIRRRRRTTSFDPTKDGLQLDDDLHPGILYRPSS